MEEAGARLVATNILPVHRWLEERLLIVTGWVAELAVVCLSVGSLSEIEDSQRSLRILICCVDFLRL